MKLNYGSYYYPVYPSYRSSHDDMMMPGMEKKDQMMEMMKQHMMVTNEIKQKVDMIDQRLRRMEEMMKMRS
jgi:hypothetical protein